MNKTPRPTLILSPLARSGKRDDENARLIYSELPQAFADAGSECTVLPLVGLDQAQARAEMLAAFRYHKRFEDALFIDSDITTHPQFILKLATLQEPLLACSYEDREPDQGVGDDGGVGAYLLETGGKKTLEVREGMQMLPIRGCGLGLTRIRRSVVETLWEKGKEAQGIFAKGEEDHINFWISHFPGLMGLEVAGLFEPIVHEHPDGSGILRRRPEDLSFFTRCRHAGFQAYCPAQIPLVHAGRGGRSFYDAMVEEQRLHDARTRRVAFDLKECPENLVGGTAFVLDGAYDIPGLMLGDQPRILDIGGNVGGFTKFARIRFPGCIIHAFEPNPEIADIYERNMMGIPRSEVALHRLAVTGTEATKIMLFEGCGNDGEATIHPIKGAHQSEGFEVEALPARKLPPCELLKIDTEGAEREIMMKYPHWDTVKGVMLEWHNYEDYHWMIRFLHAKGFAVVVDRTRGRAGVDRELCFARPEAMSTYVPPNSNGIADKILAGVAELATTAGGEAE